MLAVQFIFQPGTYDEDFHTLDDAIDTYAKSLEGYLGVDRWVSEDGSRVNAIYYFSDNDSLALLSRYPDHLAAKKQVTRWYEGYQIVVSEVTGMWGDGRISHPAVARPDSH